MRLRMRRIARSLGVGVGAVTAGALALQLVAEWRISRVRPLTPVFVAAASDATALARGRHLVEVVAQCTTCHGADLAGRPMAEDAWLGTLYAPNLTPGAGGIGEHSDADLVRAIRYGQKRDGRPVVMMPSQYLFHLSDSDVAAVLGYLRALTPVDARSPESRLGFLSALAIASGRVPDLIPADLIEDGLARMVPPPIDASAAYGAYLVETGGCKVCHHENLAGGLHLLSLPDEPPPSDLTRGGPLAAWSEADFLRTLRTGVTPGGRRLDAAWMPWPSLARMSDLELRAIWRYLRTLGDDAESSVQSQTEKPLGDGAA